MAGWLNEAGGVIAGGNARDPGGALASVAPRKHGMNPTDETVVKLSKTKIALLLLGCCVFVAIGVWMFAAAGATGRPRGSTDGGLVVRGFGLAAILFFGLAGLYALKMLCDRRPGLVFNSHGFVNNTSIVAAGLIPWSEVAGAGVFEVQKQKMLIVEVRDPRKYIAAGGALRRAVNKVNYELAGSAIYISPSALAISFPDLLTLFDRYQQKYGGRNALPLSLSGDDAGRGAAPFRLAAEVESRLLNWSPLAVRGTLGAGGIGILTLSLSSLDQLLPVRIPFWVAFTVALLPMFIFFVAVPDFLPPRVVRPAQWFAVVWYLFFAALSLALAAYHGFEPVEVYLAGFILLGAWPCVLAVRGLRVAGKT